MNKFDFSARAWAAAILIIALFPLTGWQAAQAQTTSGDNQTSAETFAFVGVTVIPMDKNRVLTDAANF